MKKIPTLASLVVLTALVAFLLASSAWAIGLGDLIKVGGVAYLVDRYDTDLDKFITKSLDEKGAAAMGATKVVPILSLGGGGYIGAAQVVGTPENVKKVKAVIQVEGNFGSLRTQVLVPVEVSKATKNPDRAKGVGVSAVIEFAI